MQKLLYIESSPRKERSASITVAKHFLNVYRSTHPNDTVETLDLWQQDLPPFNNSTIDAKYAIMHGQNMSPEQSESWNAIVKIIEHFKSADKYLFSVPMWNFSIPYILKHYIDLLVQPTLTFSYSQEKGYKGMLSGKSVAVIYSRGAVYAQNSGSESYDLQTKYFNQILAFIGFSKIKSIIVEPTLDPAAKDKILSASKEKARKMAQTF